MVLIRSILTRRTVHSITTDGSMQWFQLVYFFFLPVEQAERVCRGCMSNVVYRSEQVGR